MIRRLAEGHPMSGIRINAAAEMLGVSTSTLRSWERRLGYPRPAPHPRQPPPLRARRGRGAARRRCARPTTSRARSRSPACAAAARPPRPAWSPPSTASTRPAADRELEQSLAVRSVERTVSELLLPALELAARRAQRRRRARARLPLGDRLAARRPPAGRQRDPRRGRAAARLRLAARASRPSTRRRWSCSCAAPGCASCCSPPGSPRAASAAPCARSTRARS